MKNIWIVLLMVCIGIASACSTNEYLSDPETVTEVEGIAHTHVEDDMLISFSQRPLVWFLAERATDLVVANYIGHSFISDTLGLAKFEVKDVIVGNAEAIIYVYIRNMVGVLSANGGSEGRVPLVENVDYLLMLSRRVNSVYTFEHIRDDAFMFGMDLVIDLTGIDGADLEDTRFDMSFPDLDFSNGIRREELISHVASLIDPGRYLENIRRREAIIRSNSMEDIILGSQEILLVQVISPWSTMNHALPPSDWMATQTYHTTVIEVLEGTGNVVAGDMIRVRFFADTVSRGEQHIVAVERIAGGSSLQFTSRNSLISTSSLPKVQAILDSARLEVIFHFDDMEEKVMVRVDNGYIDPAHIPTPATRYGREGVPGQVLMGWFTELYEDMHNLASPGGVAVPFDLTQHITRDMADEEGNIHLYASWLQYGDVNGDGNVDHDDVMDMRLWLASRPVEIHEKSADVNLDNLVNQTDLMRIVMFLNFAGPGMILGIPDPNIPLDDYNVIFDFDSQVITIPVSNGGIDMTQITEEELLLWDLELLNHMHQNATSRGRTTALTVQVENLTLGTTEIIEMDTSALQTDAAALAEQISALETELATVQNR